MVGDDLDVIGSGPTAPDCSTFADARRVLERYRIWDRAPRSVRERLAGAVDETPKPGDPIFRRVRNRVIGSNRIALAAAARRARELGYRTQVLSSEIVGETRDVARMHAAILREAARRPRRPMHRQRRRNYGHHSRRRSGRTQSGIRPRRCYRYRGLPDAVVFSAGTDGTDGPTDAAGAIADG